MSTSIKIEDTLNEVRAAEGINTDLPIVSSTGITLSGAITAANISTLTTGSAGAFVVNGLLTAGAGITATGNVAGGAFYVGALTGPGIVVGSVTGGVAPTQTGAQGSLFLNTAGTGPASRLFVNATGLTLWIPITTAA